MAGRQRILNPQGRWDTEEIILSKDVKAVENSKIPRSATRVVTQDTLPRNVEPDPQRVEDKEKTGIKVEVEYHIVETEYHKPAHLITGKHPRIHKWLSQHPTKLNRRCQKK